MKTKAARRAELLRRLERGPTFSALDYQDKALRERIEQGYRLWAQSWIIPEVESLIPPPRPKAAKESK